MAKFADEQPKDGEVVMHCKHLADYIPSGSHFFHSLKESEFVRPDGTIGESAWIALCESCFQLHSMDPTEVVAGDHVWLGDEPIIEELEKN